LHVAPRARCDRRFVAALLVALCIGSAKAADPARHPWTHPNELRVELGAEPGSLNPLLQLNDYENFVTRLAFDQLVTTDSDGRTLLPRLARVVPTLGNGGISRDGRTITWHLRRDVRWQDGVPFTSRDIKYTLAAILDPKNNVPIRRGFDLVQDVRTPDPYTAVVRLRHPFAPAVTWFFGDGSSYTIVPAHVLEREPDFNRAAFDALPIGTGPFRIVRWQHGQELDLEAFDGYYRGAPPIKKIVVRFVPDENSAIAQLRTHEADVFAVASTNAYGQLRSIPGVSVALSNVHGASTVLMNNTVGELRDERLRRAIAEAIDRRALVRNVDFGAATPAVADLPDFMWAFDAHVRAVPYDPAGAARLLRAAGYTAGPDGMMSRAGRPLTLVLAYAENSATARTSAIQIQAYLHAVGIALDLKGYSGQQMFGGFSQGGIYQTGHFDLAWYTMTLGVDPDSSGRFSCASIPPNGQNYSRYCNREVDAAEAAGLSTFDAAARKRAYAIVQRALVRDVPIVFVAYPKNIDAYNSDLHGFRPNPATGSWNANEWSI
jgi:peptide/nickel transport system substrate-binding protein